MLLSKVIVFNYFNVSLNDVKLSEWRERVLHLWLRLQLFYVVLKLFYVVQSAVLC